MGIAVASVSTRWTSPPAQIDPGDQGGQKFSTAPTAFFGATPIVQPTGNAQIALASQPGGQTTTWSTTQSPSLAANISSSESSLTVQSGTVTNSACSSSPPNLT